jgi:hypothetical protein
MRWHTDLDTSVSIQRTVFDQIIFDRNRKSDVHSMCHPATLFAYTVDINSKNYHDRKVFRDNSFILYAFATLRSTIKLVPFVCTHETTRKSLNGF